MAVIENPYFVPGKLYATERDLRLIKTKFGMPATMTSSKQTESYPCQTVFMFLGRTRAASRFVNHYFLGPNGTVVGLFEFEHEPKQWFRRVMYDAK